MKSKEAKKLIEWLNNRVRAIDRPIDLTERETVLLIEIAELEATLESIDPFVSTQKKELDKKVEEFKKRYI